MPNRYSEMMRPTATPQNQPVADREMISNAAGGYAFETTNWKRLLRWLALGSEGSGFYANERDLTFANVKCLRACIAEDGERVVLMVRDADLHNVALRRSTLIFALAEAFRYGSIDTRRAVGEAVQQVIRTGSEWLEFVSILRAKPRLPFNRTLRRIASDWYRREAKSLAYQLIKYRSRHDLSHNIVARLAHPKPESAEHNELFRWLVKADNETFSEALAQVEAYEQAKSADTPRLVELITRHRLPREAVPNEKLNEAAVWEALLQEMPMRALVRNLGKLSSIGLTKPMSDTRRDILAKLNNGAALRAARLHPLAFMIALDTYAQGAGTLGSLRWKVDQAICDALSSAFYEAFAALEPSDRKVVIAIDVSGSMQHGRVHGTSIPVIEGAAALAMIFQRLYPNGQVIGVDTSLHTDMAISPSMRLDDVTRRIKSCGGGGTNLELVPGYLERNGIFADGLVMITDGESWAGNRHVFQALASYRSKINPAFRSVNIVTEVSRTQLNDPNDLLTMEIAGFGTDVPLAADLFFKVGI